MIKNLIQSTINNINRVSPLLIRTSHIPLTYSLVISIILFKNFHLFAYLQFLLLYHIQNLIQFQTTLTNNYLIVFALNLDLICATLYKLLEKYYSSITFKALGVKLYSTLSTSERGVNSSCRVKLRYTFPRLFFPLGSKN